MFTGDRWEARQEVAFHYTLHQSEILVGQGLQGENRSDRVAIRPQRRFHLRKGGHGTKSWKQVPCGNANRVFSWKISFLWHVPERKLLENGRED
jgi:hypothetical protein